jgi:uncharacterized damage-inducible protein DinB
MDATLSGLLDAYAAAPRRVETAVRGMSHEQHVARPMAGKWSTLEVVAHLADTEQVYCDRMKRIIATQRPLLIGYHESDYVARLAYHDRELDEELQIIRINRAQMLRILRTLPAETFDRQGVHNKAGLVSLRQLVESMIEHIEHHCGFIDQKRQALGIES